MCFLRAEALAATIEEAHDVAAADPRSRARRRAARSGFSMRCRSSGCRASRPAACFADRRTLARRPQLALSRASPRGRDVLRARGELTFFDGARKIRGSAGSTVFLPREIPHGFRADTAARILILTTPAGFDEFVAEAGEPATRLELPTPSVPDFAQLTRYAAKYGIEILGPLPE